jgi:hypothetical protein
MVWLLFRIQLGRKAGIHLGHADFLRRSEPFDGENRSADLQEFRGEGMARFIGAQGGAAFHNASVGSRKGQALIFPTSDM